MAGTVDCDGELDYNSLRTCVYQILGVAAAILLLVLLIEFYAPLGPLYAASIDSVSGLDDVPTTTPEDLALNPQFNLTIRVTSRSFGRSACMEAGAYVEVSYRCVLLAASGASPERICAEPYRPRDVGPVVARGVGVRLPGYMREGLAADLRNGVHAGFEVAIKISNADFDNGLLASCKGMRAGGDSTAALETTCGLSRPCADDNDHRPIRSFLETYVNKKKTHL